METGLCAVDIWPSFKFRHSGRSPLVRVMAADANFDPELNLPQRPGKRKSSAASVSSKRQKTQKAPDGEPSRDNQLRNQVRDGRICKIGGECDRDLEYCMTV